MVKNLLAYRRPGFSPWAGKILWRRAWQSTLVFLPGEPHGQRSLVGHSPGDRKELNMTEWLTHFHFRAQTPGSRQVQVMTKFSPHFSWRKRSRKLRESSERIKNNNLNYIHISTFTHHIFQYTRKPLWIKMREKYINYLILFNRSHAYLAFHKWELNKSYFHLLCTLCE